MHLVYHHSNCADLQKPWDKTPTPDSGEQVLGYHRIPATTAQSQATDPVAHPPVDLIFVHGLGGQSKGTWTYPNGSFWPDWLHSYKGLESVRINTFGYDSDWTKIFQPRSNLGISDFARSLCERLRMPDDDEKDVRISS